jgi:hypothetical protein
MELHGMSVENSIIANSDLYEKLIKKAKEVSEI